MNFDKKVEIRIAIPSDAPMISLLARTTFREAFGDLFRDPNDLLEYFERTFSVEKIEGGLKKTTNIFWIAYVDRLPVGYGKLKLDSPSEFIKSGSNCQLQKIYILKDFLSMKIGLKLQTEMLKKAVEHNFEKIWLSVYGGNIRAIKFYERNGFEKIGAHDFSIGKEDFHFFVMVKKLSDD